MSHIERTMHIWKCDIPECIEKLTAGEDHLYAIDRNWGQYTISSFGIGGDRRHYFPETKFILCTDHADQLKGFFFREQNRIADNSTE